MSIASGNILGSSKFNKAMNVIKWFALTVFLICLTMLGQQPAFLTNGLVAYYPFNANSNYEIRIQNVDAKCLIKFKAAQIQ